MSRTCYFLSELINRGFFERFSTYSQVSNLIKFRPVGSEFHADGRTQTVMTKLIIAFHNFPKASKDGRKLLPIADSSITQ
jgi:hypothetical protein